MRKIAVFDIDGTLFRSSLLIELVEALIDEGIFEVSTRTIYKREKVRWLDRKGSYESYISAVVEAFMKNIKGVQYADFERAVRKVVRLHKNRTYQYTRDFIRELKKKKYFLLAISQSPKGILDEFCKRLGFNKIYGRFYELGPTERFTGAVVDLHFIGNKGVIVRRVVSQYHLTLTGSIGVGDTEGDISFLELVERPICFNPNVTLYRHALRNHWEVVVERKDVIYKLQTNT